MIEQRVSTQRSKIFALLKFPGMVDLIDLMLSVILHIEERVLSHVIQISLYYTICKSLTFFISQDRSNY